MSDCEKKCRVCGRIITDDKNITRLCPKHQKQGNSILGAIGGSAVVISVKKYGPKVFKGIIKVLKK